MQKLIKLVTSSARTGDPKCKSRGENAVYPNCLDFESYKLQSWKVVKIFRDDANSQRKTTTKFQEKGNYVPTTNETDRTISLSKLNS